MTLKDRKIAKSLAVSYEAYMESWRGDDRSGLQVWGRILKQAQEASGICLITYIKEQD
jgi:hypothetical protein